MLDNTLNKPDTNEVLDKNVSINNIDINDVKISKLPYIFRSIKDAFIYLIISLIIILAIRFFVVQHVRVEGTSMEPTLHDGQHLLLEKLSYRFKDVERFDIIVFRPYYDEKDTFYVKRVVGLPGETVQIKDNIIYINDKPLVDKYGENTFTDGKMAEKKIQLGDDDYFVLGDNREVSKDSREEEVGLLNEESIVGRVWLSIYPTDKMGLVEH